MARTHQYINWDLPVSGNGLNWQHVEIAVLMDIRRELQKLNSVLQCPNFIAVPMKLDAIRLNTAAIIANTNKKPRRRRRRVTA